MSGHQSMDVHPGDAKSDYEDTRREVRSKYNALLLDAERRLQIALDRMRKCEIEVCEDKTQHLTREILELIDYLSQARL